MATATTTGIAPGAKGGADGARVRDPILSSSKRTYRREALLGAAIIVGFALAGWLWHLTTLNKVPALATSRDLERGETLDADDLETVHLSGAGSLTLLSPDDASQIIGQTVTAALPEGTLVSEDLVLDVRPVGVEDGVVGLPLAAGQYPTFDLAPGDLVEVVVSPSGATIPAAEPVIALAEVLSIGDLGDGERRLVSLRAARADADAIAAVDPEAIRLVWVAPS